MFEKKTSILGLSFLDDGSDAKTALMVLYQIPTLLATNP